MEDFFICIDAFSARDIDYHWYNESNPVKVSFLAYLPQFGVRGTRHKYIKNTFAQGKETIIVCSTLTNIYTNEYNDKSKHPQEFLNGCMLISYLTEM